MFHVSLPAFLAFVAQLIIAGFFLRTIAAKFSDHPVGKALAFIY